MNVLSTAIRLDNWQTVPHAEPRSYFQKRVNRVKPKMVSEAEYWENYYSNPDIIYEWNNGILEEKAVSNKETTSMYGWIFELTGYYFKTYPIGERTFLETGFRMALPHKVAIRRPDLGVILYNNPIPYQAKDHSYRGTCNLCVEALSDLKKKDIERDTVTKFGEYEAAGVEEYYILYAEGFPMEFYYLNKHGVYTPMEREGGDLIKSQVLPGFQFRISDLYKQPLPQEMAFDPVYEKFVLPYYQEEKKRADAESQLRQKAEKLAQKEAQRVQEEKKRADAESRLRQKAEKLAQKEAQRAEVEAQRANTAEARAQQAEAKAQRTEAAEARAKEAEERIKLFEAELARLGLPNL